MPDYEINPFQELYVTDSADPKVFVQLFSDEPVKSAHQLFRPGNVVLKGTQGSGKSTLLGLFRPEIRVAYHHANSTFPIPVGLSNYVAAGINFTKSGILDIGQRPLGVAQQDDEAMFPFIFSDFLNYYVVRDLLASISLMIQRADAFNNLVDGTKLEDFVQLLSEQDCWLGALAGRNSFRELEMAIDHRITSYRKFHLFILPVIPQDICESRTNIGEPIARAAACMRQVGLIQDNTPVFIRIDQVERLLHSDPVRPALGAAYRRVVNKAVGLRDARVSYRIGTRQYAWEDDLHIFGTNDRLEELRDFKVIDLDANQRRGENSKTWVFPRFAQDALHRRTVHAGHRIDAGTDILRLLFDSAPAPKLAASEYVAKPRNPERIIGHKDMPPVWKEFLETLYKDDPLVALLAAAWARQKGTDKEANRMDRNPPKKAAPWNNQYWRKERIRQALMQMAARSPHRLKWSGKEQILALSGSNITVFLSICHEIWDAMYRFQRASGSTESPTSGGIDRSIQSVGIHAASDLWYQKITEQPGGDDRQRFVELLGAKFRAWLVNDASMSFPGRNGFSLTLNELKQSPAVQRFLNEAVSYGDLYGVPHTTKERPRRPRRKWYLNPILSPHFQIPETHTKEPFYSTLADVQKWLQEAQVTFPGQPEVVTPRSQRKRKSASGETPNLFETNRTEVEQ